MHKRITAGALIWLTVGQIGQAQPLDDPAFIAMPRTADELIRISAAIKAPVDFITPEPFEAKPAGAATVAARATAGAFAIPAANLLDTSDFVLGQALFNKLWVAAPASTLASDGLGPLYNARSCAGCHAGAGRGHPPFAAGEPSASMIMRVSVPAAQTEKAGIKAYLATLPDPVYGKQIQTLAIAGHRAEARVIVDYDEIPVNLNGGEIIRLRRPTYRLESLGYGKRQSGSMLSARVAPALIGMGLLDAIPAADILAAADPKDVNGDGISGRANMVMSVHFGVPTLGRFGLKAGEATLREQTASAFSTDMGLSSDLHPDGWGDCTESQASCRTAQDGSTGAGDGREVSTQSLNLTTLYVANLGVPARRDITDSQVLQGKETFYQSGCAACHTPKFVTARLRGNGPQSFQLIWPFSDLLLHDMGDGLADHRPEALATGREWRTAPLWGIGMTQTVSGHTLFLHDGRARSLLEAVLWHDGEAKAARDHVIALNVNDRAALIRYLESL